RPKIYSLFIRHEVFILSSLLPETTDFTKWLGKFHTQPEGEALTLLPTTYDTGFLWLGIQQSIEQLNEIMNLTTFARSILGDKSMSLLMSYLRSLPLDQFYNAEVTRIMLFVEHLEPFKKKLEEIQALLKPDTQEN
ncbi:MAG: hypothetical protein ACFFCO_09080, partial [Promethearchaeota archaeon]